MRNRARYLAPALAGLLVACGGGGGGTGGGGGGSGSAQSAENVYLNAMPPGANGNSAGGVPAGTDPSNTQYPSHYNDTLALYGDLAYAKTPLTAPDNCTCTDADITLKHNRPPNNAGEHEPQSDSACNYFKHEGLTPDTVDGTPETLTCPANDPGNSSVALTCAGKTVTITRDGWGVPYVDGQDRAAAEFGFGYAQAEDRLWFFDVIRNVGKGHESKFLGPFQGAYDMDSSFATLAGYDDGSTNAGVNELTAMLDGAKTKFNLATVAGKGMGDQFTEDLDNFVAGFNQYIHDLQGAKANKVPPEYTSLKPGGFPPAAWTREDIVASAILIQAFFAGGGGGEVANELLLQRLAADNGTTFGPASGSIPSAACLEWRDLRHANDPDAWRTIDQSFKTQSPPAVD